jgi:hypothetical protein
MDLQDERPTDPWVRSNLYRVKKAKDGWVYLHRQFRSLMLRPTKPPEYPEPGWKFIGFLWPYEDNLQGKLLILIEAMAMGIDRERLLALADKWDVGNQKAIETFCSSRDLVVDSWSAGFLARRVGFLAGWRDPSGNGKTRLDALAELVKDDKFALGYRARLTLPE